MSTAIQIYTLNQTTIPTDLYSEPTLSPQTTFPTREARLGKIDEMDTDKKT